MGETGVSDVLLDTAELWACVMSNLDNVGTQWNTLDIGRCIKTTFFQCMVWPLRTVTLPEKAVTEWSLVCTTWRHKLLFWNTSKQQGDADNGCARALVEITKKVEHCLDFPDRKHWIKNHSLNQKLDECVFWEARRWYVENVMVGMIVWWWFEMDDKVNKC